MAVLRSKMTVGNNPQKLPEESIMTRIGEQGLGVCSRTSPKGSGIFLIEQELRGFKTNQSPRGKFSASNGELCVFRPVCMETGHDESSLKYAQWPQWASYVSIQTVLSPNSRQK